MKTYRVKRGHNVRWEAITVDPVAGPMVGYGTNREDAIDDLCRRIEIWETNGLCKPSGSRI